MSGPLLNLTIVIKVEWSPTNYDLTNMQHASDQSTKCKRGCQPTQFCSFLS